MVQASFNRLYSIQVWLSSVVLAPAILILLSSPQWMQQPGTLAVIAALGFLASGVGALLSLPVFLIHYLLNVRFRKSQLPVLGLQLVLTAVAIAGVWAILYYMDMQFWNGFDLPVVYAVSICATGLLYKVYE